VLKVRRRLERLEEYLDKTEALMNYRRVVEEKTEFQEKIKALQIALSKTQGDLSEFQNLKTTLAGKEMTLKEFRRKIHEETRKEYGVEIERRARRKFEAEAPGLVEKELQRVLELPTSLRPRVLNQLLDKKVDERVNRILKAESAWPTWFKERVEGRVNAGVKRGLDEAFHASVRAAITRAKQTEWPMYITKYTRERITPFCKNLLIDQFVSQLADKPLEVRCDRCGVNVAFSLTPDDVAHLFKGSPILVVCVNPHCVDGLFSSRHKIRVGLGDVVMGFAGKPGNPTVIKAVPVKRHSPNQRPG
jgi:hypothetical protein